MKKNKINYLTTSVLIPLILSLQVLYNVYVRNKNKNKYLSAITIILLVYLFLRFYDTQNLFVVINYHHHKGFKRITIGN